MDLIKNVFWQVSLSNGETFFENKGRFVEIPNELSPWQKLYKYIAENKLLITSLSLYTNDGRTFNLPSAGKNPKFKPFNDAPKPIDYNFFRAIAREFTGMQEGNKATIINTKISDWFTIIEASYPSYKLQLWVDNRNTKNCWVLVVKND